MKDVALISRRTALKTLGAAAATSLVPRSLRAALPRRRGSKLAAIHEALLRVESGGGQARLLFLGASHVETDAFTGVIRRALQGRYGDAGHGLVLPAKSCAWYHHRGVEVRDGGGWAVHTVRAARQKAPVPVGPASAGVVLVSAAASARAGVATVSGDGFGARVGRFEIFLLKRPGAGTLRVAVDGEAIGEVPTDAEVTRPASVVLRFPDGPHALELRPAGDGPVHLYGVALDRRGSGVIVDSAGLHGARCDAILAMHPGLLADHLARRRPDLVALAYGTNAVSAGTPTGTYRKRYREAVSRVQRAAPDASILLIGPSDLPLSKRGGKQRRHQQSAIIDAQRDVAAELGCAHFDIVSMMGGEGAMARWHRQGLAKDDLVHFTARGYARLADALLEVIVPARSTTA